MTNDGVTLFRSLGDRGFLAFRAHQVIGYVPAGQRGRVRLNSGRPELSVNKVSRVRVRLDFELERGRRELLML
jgi:hypothetical protein